MIKSIILSIFSKDKEKIGMAESNNKNSAEEIVSVNQDEYPKLKLLAIGVVFITITNLIVFIFPDTPTFILLGAAILTYFLLTYLGIKKYSLTEKTIYTITATVAALNALANILLIYLVAPELIEALSIPAVFAVAFFFSGIISFVSIRIVRTI